MDRFDVVVVGAGPTGLMLGTELRLRGVRTVVVERLEARNEFGKAQNIQPRTAEILELRGLLDVARADHQALGKVIVWMFQIPEANRAVAAMVSGLDINYGGDELVGTCIRDFKVAASWASAAFHSGHGVLFARDEKYLAEARPWSSPGSRASCR